MNGMFQGEGSLASSQQGSSGIMSKPAKEEAKPEKEEAKPEKTPVSFNFQGEGGEDNNSDNTDSGTVVTNKEVDDVIAEYKLPTVLTSYNNTVKNLQTYLNTTPVAPGLSTDGRWGAKTSAAVSDFKRYKDELYKTTAAETFDETGGIVSRPATANYMQYINETYVGGREEINKANIIPITDQSGAFSDTGLEIAISGSVRNPIKQSLLKGAIKIETGGGGPVTEDDTYSISAAKKVFTGVDTVVATLPSDVAARLQYDYDNKLMAGNRTATNADMQALGIAMMDEKYDGGHAKRGRGLIQITGASNYLGVQNILADRGITVDLGANPELVNDPRYALPAALAFLEYAGLTDAVAEGMSTKQLNNMINSGAGREIAENRWNAVISSLRAAGDTVKADGLELRNEYAAQVKANTTNALQIAVDGSIGPNSRVALRGYLTGEGVTIPANITDDALVILVNEN